MIIAYIKKLLGKDFRFHWQGSDYKPVLPSSNEILNNLEELNFQIIDIQYVRGELIEFLDRFHGVLRKILKKKYIKIMYNIAKKY